MWSGKRILAAAAALLLLAGCSTAAEPEKETILTGLSADSIKDEKLYPLEVRDLVEEERITLRVQNSVREDLHPPREGLFLEKISVTSGSRVKKGDILAEFSVIHSSEAALREAELALKRLTEDYEDRLEETEKAIRNSWGTQRELLELSVERMGCTYEWEKKKLEKEVREKREELEPVYLLAPYDCVVNVINMVPGREVGRYESVLIVSPLNGELLAAQDVTDRFSYGQEVEVEVSEDGEPFTARIISSRYMNEDDVLAVPTDRKEGEWPKYMNAVLKRTVQTSVLAVPKAAIHEEDGAQYVLISVEGVPRRRYIVSGVTSGSGPDTIVVVLSGVEPGQQVILP